MKEFGEFSGLSEKVSEDISEIITYLRELDDEDISIYYGYPMIELDGKESIMKGCIVSRTGIIGLYEVKEEAMVYARHFMQIIMSSETLSPLYFQGVPLYESVELGNIDKIKERFNRAPLFSHSTYKEINGIIQNIYGLNGKDDRNIEKTGSLGEIIKKRTNDMNMLDQNQFNGIYNNINSHIRIRGLAGSGKTILLVKKMAYMHYKNRDLDLAYVFYTKSLKQYVLQLFKLYYKDFEKYKDPDMSKIHILHSWGGNEMKGFYSVICEENGLNCRNWMSAGSLGGTDRLESVCNEVLKVTEKTGLKPMYNYIFIDEAQDFKLSFFLMAKKTLKYTGKIIYAYDELQSLNESTSIPSKAAIFGQETCEDVDLSVCYRTPRDILVTAHALGLGIYKKDKNGQPDLVNMMEDYSIWRAIGYREIEGTLGYGNHVVLGRDEVIEHKPNDCVEVYAVDDTQSQYRAVANEILNLVNNEDVVLEDILIIDLSTLNLQDDFSEFRNEFKNAQGDASNHKVHLVNKDNAIAFKRKGSITYTTIFRAKGNEANIVFVLNAHKSSMLSYSRNRLFTAMTRAKFKTYVYGVTSEVMMTLYEEYEEVKKKNYLLEFVYPTEEKLKEMQSIAKIESEKMDTVQKVYKDVGKDTSVTIEVLKEQFGATTLRELIEELQKGIDE